LFPCCKESETKQTKGTKVSLDFQLLSNELSWTNTGFNLQTAPAVTGPFTNLPAAMSPYTNPLTAPQQFFRLISN